MWRPGADSVRLNEHIRGSSGYPRRGMEAHYSAEYPTMQLCRHVFLWRVSLLCLLRNVFDNFVISRAVVSLLYIFALRSTVFSGGSILSIRVAVFYVFALLWPCAICVSSTQSTAHSQTK